MGPRGTPLVALALAALAALGCHERDPRPNLLVISLDSVRADFVGAYGARLPHAPERSPTPSLDRLAAEGVLYENARATTSWTLSSHVSLFTGVPELVHGVEQDGERIPASLPTLAETLASAGYRTAGVYSGPYLDPRHGFARGFERYEAGYGKGLSRAVDERAVAQRLLDSVDARSDPARAQVAVARLGNAERELELASHRDVSSERVTDLARDELARAAEDGRPFFLFAHYFDAHFDYVPPAPFASAFDPEYAGTLDAQDYFTNPAIAPFDATSPSGRRRVVSQRDLEHIEALYAGEIAWTDSQVGRLLAELERLGLAANTLVVVLADHGDEFLEHGSIGHRRTLFEEVLRVPLVLRLPGRLPAGERRTEPLVLADMHEVILEALEGSTDRERSPVAPIERLVRPEFARLAFELDGRPDSVEGLRVHVLEGFQAGALKILRERSFPRATAPLDPLRSAAFERAARDEFAREELRWIDLAAHPDEESSAWSTDFSEARAREALERFRSSYTELVRRRAEPEIAAESAELLSALRGLGYTGQDARLGTLGNEELVLPPPGR